MAVTCGAAIEVPMYLPGSPNVRTLRVNVIW